MVTVAVPKARATLADTPGGLEITVPARTNWASILFLGFWLIGWACGEVFAIREFAAATTPGFAKLFILAWLGVWTTAGGFTVYAWLWAVSGKERIVLQRAALSLKREVLGLGRERRYDIVHVSNLRVAPLVDVSSSQQFWGIGGGRVAFDYGPKTIYFAAAVDDPEAAEIVGRLKARHTFK